MNPLATGILTGLFASLFFTPVGGVVVGLLTYNEMKKRERNES